MWKKRFINLWKFEKKKQIKYRQITHSNATNKLHRPDFNPIISWQSKHEHNLRVYLILNLVQHLHKSYQIRTLEPDRQNLLDDNMRSEEQDYILCPPNFPSDEHVVIQSR